VAEFFPTSVADPTPFEATARAIYSYETTRPTSPQEVTVSRAATEWSGYKRQPERCCFYIGFTIYIPKVERRDLSIYKAKNLELRGTRAIPDSTRQQVAAILNQPYEDIHFQGVGHAKRESELAVATRFGKEYSENNMGFGEGRVLYMVDRMETAPEQSLFVLEEPETSLHEEAQYRLTKYFLDVCLRRHHQLILSTHSSVILEALPAEARKLLLRDPAGVTAYSGISSTRARAVLSGGAQRALNVCVEDDFASQVLTELIRAEDPGLLKAIRIHAIGSKNDVRDGIKLLRRLGYRAMGIRDGDVGAATTDGLYSLPGTRPPECEVFNNPVVTQAMQDHFQVDIPTLLATRAQTNHHSLPQLIANAGETQVDAVIVLASKAYVTSVPENQRRVIVRQIEALA
jgi:hypothetical protein